MPDDDFARLVREWQAGSGAALGTLLGRHQEAVRAAVRKRLHDKLRKEYDSLDFVQDVWASVAAAGPERYEVRTPEALVVLLSRIAENKVVDVIRARFQSLKRDIKREERLPANPDVTDGGLLDRQPRPSQEAVGAERWAALLDRLPAGHRAIAERLRDGYTHQEIAREDGINVRTVERVVRRLKDLCAT